MSLTPRGGGTHTARASAPHGPCVGLAGCLGSPHTRLSHRRRHAPRERSELLWSRNWAPQTPMSVPVTHGPCHTHRQTPAAIPGGVVQARAVALPSLLSPALGPLRSIPGAPEEHPRRPTSLLATHPVPLPLVSSHRQKTQQPCPAGC